MVLTSAVSEVHSQIVRKRTAYTTALAELPVFAIQKSTKVVRDAGLDFRLTFSSERNPQLPNQRESTLTLELRGG